MSKQWLLVKFKANWADEMEIEGFSLFEKLAWDNVVTAINNHPFPDTFSVGSNQEVTVQNAKEILSKYNVQKITGDEYQSIIELFGSQYGNFKAPWEYWDTDDMEMPETEYIE